MADDRANSDLKGFDPVYETVGDLSLSFLARPDAGIDPATPAANQVKLEISRTGHRRTLQFPGVVHRLDAFKEAITGLVERVQDGGEVDADGFEPMDWMVADMRITIALTDNATPVLELTDPQGTKEVFYSVLTELDALQDLVERLDLPEQLPAADTPAEGAGTTATGETTTDDTAESEAAGTSARDTINSILTDDSEEHTAETKDDGTGDNPPHDGSMLPEDQGDADIVEDSEEHTGRSETEPEDGDLDGTDTDADVGDTDGTVDTADVDTSDKDGPDEVKSQYEVVLAVIEDLAGRLDQSVPVDDVVDAAEERDITESNTRSVISRLGREGKLYQPESGHVQLLEVSSDVQPGYTEVITAILEDLDAGDDAVPVEDVITKAQEQDVPRSDASDAINWLKKEGKIFEPTDDHLMML